MRIGINTLALLNTTAGAERYAQNIINNLARIDKDNQYYLFLSKMNHQIYQIKQDNFKNIIYNFPAQNRLLRIFYEQFVLPREIKKYKIDILFSPTNVVPLKMKCASVVMVFDLHWFFFSHLFSKLRSFYMTKMIKNAIKKADVILTLSNSSKNDIIKLFNICTDKIKITPCSVFGDDNKRSLDGLSAFKEKKEPYILFVGQTHKRKNIISIIKAYFILKKDNNIPHKLLLVGRPGDAQKEVEKLVFELNLIEFVKIIGHTTDKQLADFYKNADLFVYPSLYEGFGIPVLEAMNFKVPVITSNMSSLPEVASQSAILVDPYKIDDLVSAILKVLQNKSLREKMIADGLKQVQKFSWAESAQITLEAFNQAYQKRSKNSR